MPKWISTYISIFLWWILIFDVDFVWTMDFNLYDLHIRSLHFTGDRFQVVVHL